jgi:membrane protease YdiL (CAAX protease family)
MGLYPIFSVLPQSITWRAFVLHRYRPLFGRGIVMLLVASIAFAFIHLVFWNVEAVVLTAIGGLMFTWTHMRTGSMLAGALEHALYGCWAFTIGFGRFLYGGTVPPPG